MLARVENDERAGMAKPRRHAGERVGAANVDGVREQPDCVGRAARPREVDEPDAVRELALERARCLDREAALAHTGRSSERNQAVLAQQSGNVGQFVLAADERRRRRREVAAAPADDRNRTDRWVVRQDCILEPPKLRPWLEPQLVSENAARLPKSLERVGLAAAAVERHHQLRPEPLPEGVVRERRTKRRRELAMLAKREPDLEVLLERVDVQRLEPARLAAEPRRASQTLQRRSAPEGQRRSDSVGRGRDVAVAQRSTGLREQLLEPDRVDARALQRVPVGRADDRPLPERGPEAGDVVMERVPGSGREILAPQTVDQPVDVNHTTLPEREHREQTLALRATHVRERSARESLERAEKPDLK